MQAAMDWSCSGRAVRRWFVWRWMESREFRIRVTGRVIQPQNQPEKRAASGCTSLRFLCLFLSFLRFCWIGVRGFGLLLESLL